VEVGSDYYVLSRVSMFCTEALSQGAGLSK